MKRAFRAIMVCCLLPLPSWPLLQGALPAQGANLALDKPATCSSHEGDYYPELAVDGDLGLESRWGANPYPQWHKVDLEAVCEIDALRMYTYWDGWRYYQYAIEVSPDDVNWTEVVDMSQNTIPSTSSGFLHRIPPATARYVRSTMLYNSANPGVHIVEIEAYGNVLPPGEIDVHPPGPIDFGPQDLNGGATGSKTVTIKNIDPDHYLILKGVSIAGPCADDFMIVSDSGEKTLGPAQVRSLEVAFDPVLAGPRTAALVIGSNDPDEPEVKVELEGTGRGRLLNLIPYPAVVEAGPHDLLLADSSRIVIMDQTLAPLADVLSKEIFMLTGIALAVHAGVPSAGDIVLAYDPQLQDEEYTLKVHARVEIRGKEYHGVAHGTASLLQMMGKGLSVPLVSLKDKPDSPYRAVSLDVARKFHSIDVLKQMVEVCRFYKIPLMGLHLTDDQNFMFPSTAYPNLDKNNYEEPAYSVAELVELEQYAAKRGVFIVPELDVPGHSSKMVQIYPQVFGSLSGSTIDFRLQSCRDGVKTIINEMCDIFQSSPFFHAGGDESGFSHLPEFADFFIELNDTVKGRNKRTLMWEGFGQGSNIPKDIWILNWEAAYYRPDLMLQNGYTVINAGWDPLYVVDHYPWIQYTYHTPEHIYGFDRFTFGHVADGMPTSNGITVPPDSDVPGAEMCCWEARGFNTVPFLRNRIPPFSARLWNPGGEASFESFMLRFGEVEAALERILFPVKVSARGLINRYWKQNQQFAESALVRMSSGLEGTIRYTLDGSEPTPASPEYTGPFALSATTTLKAALFQGADRLGFVTRIGYQKVAQADNITKGKEVITDATLFIEHPPSLVVDGVVDQDTYWTAYRNPKWIRIDLGSPVSMDQITVYSRWGGGYYEQYTVEISLDGLNWMEVADHSQNKTPATPSGYSHDFQKTDARYIRVNTLGNSWFPSGHFPRIVEIRAREAP